MQKAITWEIVEKLNALAEKWETFAGINECIGFQNKYSEYYLNNPKETMVVTYITPGNAYYEGMREDLFTKDDLDEIVFLEDCKIGNVNGLHFKNSGNVGFYVAVDKNVLKDENLLKMDLSQREKLIYL